MEQNRIKEPLQKTNYSKRAVAFLLVLLQLSILITNEIPSFHNHSSSNNHDSLHCGSDHLATNAKVPTVFENEESQNADADCPYFHWNRTSQKSAEQLFTVYLIDQPQIQTSNPHQAVLSLDLVSLYHSRAPPTV